MKTVLVAVLVLAPFSEALSQFGRVIYISPDENLRAVVVPVTRADAPYGSEAIIRSTSGQIITRHIYGSDNRKRRANVLCGAWSPDSEFFVYDVTISVAHSPAYLTTCVFVRRLSQVYDVGYFIGGSLVDPQFSLSGRSRLRGGRLKSNGRLESFEVDLSKIDWTKKT